MGSHTIHNRFTYPLHGTGNLEAIDSGTDNSKTIGIFALADAVKNVKVVDVVPGFGYYRAAVSSSRTFFGMGWEPAGSKR